MSKETSDLETQTLSETEHFMVWEAREPDEEVTYHLELNSVTLHFFQEEWDELLQLIRALD